MPVTAKLSKLFYDRLGDQVVAELVDWLNAVDVEYRTVLRDTNESNFARFEKRFAEQDAWIERRFAEQDARIEKRFAEQDKRIAEQFTRVDARFTELGTRMERRFGGVDAKFAETREFMERALKEQTRWMFVAWASLLIPIIGLWMRP